MRPSAFLIVGIFFVRAAAAQTPEGMDRWLRANDDALMRFLPNASSAGMTEDPAPAFSGPANETYAYKGANSMVHKYPSYAVHQTWWINDTDLARQKADLDRDARNYKDESQRTVEEFLKTHDADMKAWNKQQQDEQEKVKQKADPLIKQGKYEEAGKILQSYKAAPYPPYQDLTDSLKKRQDDLDARQRKLSGLRRNIEFRIQTNRTPTTTAPVFSPKPAGTLAGHPFFRQLRGNMNMGSRTEALVDLAVFLGPQGYKNPLTKIGTKELTTKCIVVWAMIESRPDTIHADEAAAKKVLESVDYGGLSKLIR